MTGRSSLRELLAGRDLRRLLYVRLAGQAGDGLFQTALLLVVFFDPNDATSAAQAAAAFAVLLLPFSLVGPFAGVFLDRWRRQRVLRNANLLRALLVTVTATALATLGDESLVVQGLALLVISTNRFILSALSAALPHVVEERQLVTANSVTTTRSNGYLVLAFGLRSSGTNWTDANASPSGTTARTTASTTGLSHHVRDLALTTTGATSNYTSFPDNSTPSTAVGIGWQIALRHTYGDLRATGTWSPGPSADAGNGHELERTYGGVSQHKITISPQTTTFGADTPLPLGGTYSYNLRRYVDTWKSSAVRRSSFVDCGNRLTQGGFEQGINTWNCSSTPTQITAAAPNEANVLDGMYALSVPASTTCSQASVALAANTQYTAVLFAKTSNSGGSTVRVGYRTVSGGTVTEYGAQNHSVGTSFTRIFHQYTQGASGQTVEFFFTTGTGTHYVDDVFLSP